MGKLNTYDLNTAVDDAFQMLGIIPGSDSTFQTVRVSPAALIAFIQQHSAAVDGREVEMQKSATHVQWRYVGEPTWVDLFALTDITDAFGNRNKLINGNFQVNQREVSGTVVLAAGAYGHDRWKAGASGCTYTFATSNNVTTLTISAGSLQQVIEGANLQSGTHTLSWAGTAQGKIGAGSYSASGVTGSVTGGTNLTIEFSTGTLSLVQLEFGSVTTTFEHRPIGAELELCQRYYQVLYGSIRGFAGIALIQHSNALSYKVNMRATPTASVSATEYEARVAISGEPVFFGNNTSDGRFEITSLTEGAFYALQNKITLSAEL